VDEFGSVTDTFTRLPGTTSRFTGLAATTYDAAGRLTGIESTAHDAAYTITGLAATHSD
jgi:YD repeat-containing protein